MFSLLLNKKYDFLRASKFLLPLSLILMVFSVVLIGTRGFNFGIDFEGGTLIQIEAPEETQIAQVREIVDNLVEGDVSVTTVLNTDPNRATLVIKVAASTEKSAFSEKIISDIIKTLEERIPSLERKSVESIGAAISSELIKKSVLAVLYTLGMIGIYIWLRFEWSYALGAVFALFHDVTLTLGLFSLFQLTFDTSVVAAILAIIGYSLNDTVIVFDRIRENYTAQHKTETFEHIINASLNETLRRTVMTSFTTLLAIFALVFFGGAELRSFSIAMFWGVMVGTYSSIFIASPILKMMGVPSEKDTTKGPRYLDV